MKNRIKVKNRMPVAVAAIAATGILTIIAVLIIVFYKEASLIGGITAAGVTLFFGAFLSFSAFYSFYTFGEEYLRLSFGFLAQKIPYGHIRLLRENKSDKSLFLVYLKNDDPDDVRAMRILIPASVNDAFVLAAREKNRLIIYEFFDKESEFGDTEN
ncbi:MAG: hypothetical protein LBP79_01130 [Clostridiales bacterium]|jgi:hypothetical protein|nr:hypothetical protein [Clostridiales bacterium]